VGGNLVFLALESKPANLLLRQTEESISGENMQAKFGFSPVQIISPNSRFSSEQINLQNGTERAARNRYLIRKC